MSYILEALRKSHRDRDQAADPILRRMDSDLRRAGRRRQVTLWIGVALLAVNAALLAWLAGKGLMQGREPGQAVMTPATPAVPVTAAPNVLAQAPAVAAAPAVQGVPPPASSANDAMLAARDMALEREQDADRRRALSSSAQRGETSAPQVEASEPSTGAAGERQPAAAVDRQFAAPAAPVTRLADTADIDVPFFMDLDPNFRSGLARLSLDVHVFSPAPSERFVLINMEKYREGDTTREGLLVDRIVADGVILEGLGQRFRLTPQ